MKILLSALLVISSCSFKKTQLENQTLKGHDQLYSEPEAPKLSPLQENEKRIVLASTNDLHGSYNPEAIQFKDEHNKGVQSIQIGGRKLMKNYFDILRETYKNVVLVDSGDILLTTKL
jgi:2',3'-cyclic-nucleotide 2'-phosphodiesterase (5'-nucleotidase family)